MQATILLDARKVGDGGIGVHLETLVAGLYELRDEGKLQFELKLLVPPLSKLLERPDSMAAVEAWAKKGECIPEPAGKYSIAEYWAIASRHKTLLRSTDLYHSPHYTLPFALNVPAVVTIHDLIHLQYPESCAVRCLARPLISSALQRCAAVIAVSAHSARLLRQSFAGALPPVYVVHNAVPRRFWFSSLSRLGQQVQGQQGQGQKVNGAAAPYCLYLGSDRRHKGFGELLECWRELRRYAPNIRVCSEAKEISFDALQLATSGERYSPRTMKLVKSLDLQTQIRWLGTLSTRELPVVMRGAVALVVSSLEEGFCLPALEAMASGVPVISTPLAAVREVCGENVWYSQDFSASSLAVTLVEALQDETKRLVRCEAGRRRAQSFTPRAQAWHTARVYQTVLCARGSGKSIVELEFSEFENEASQSAHCGGR